MMQFIQRARVLAFYRTILRSTRRIPDPATRAETLKFVRDEFERHRGVTDLVGPRRRWLLFFWFMLPGFVLSLTSELTYTKKDHIRYLLSTGKTEWETMERYINGL